MLYFLKCLNVKTGRKRASIYLKHHLTYRRWVMTLPGADAWSVQPGGVERLGRRPRGGVRAEPGDVRFSLLQAHYLNALSTDKGIMNSHVDLSPIKLSAKGSVGCNSKAKAPWSHAKGETPCRLSWQMKEKGSCSPFFECIQINIYICMFSFMSYFAQLSLESIFPRHLKLESIVDAE